MARGDYEEYTGHMVLAQRDVMAGEYVKAQDRMLRAGNIAIRQPGDGWHQRLEWARACLLETFANERNRDTQEET